MVLDMVSPTRPYVDLPGGELVEEGLPDLEQGIESAAALLVASFATRLRSLGVPVPDVSISEPEHRLYRLLAETEPKTAHHRYNALVSRLVSFAQATECVR